MAPPTFVQEAETVWNTTTTPKTTSAFDVVAGDVLVALAIQSHSFGSNTFTCAGGSLTWTLRQEFDANNFTWVALWTAIVDANKNMATTLTRTGGSADIWGTNVLTFRGSDGVGASSQGSGASGAPTLNLTTTQADSAIVVATADWNAVDGGSRVWRTGAGALTEQSYFRDSALCTLYAGYHANAGAIGAKTVGLTDPAGQKYSIAAVEILGTASAPPDVPSRAVTIYQAIHRAAFY